MSEFDLTTLLREAYDGREGAFDELMEHVHTDLERMATAALRREYGQAADAITLEPAALVNETYLRLIKQRQRYDNRGHFFAIASRVMMRVLMDHHRSRRREKRGGDRLRVTLSGLGAQAASPPAVDAVAIVDAFEKLEQLDARTADVAKMRLLWGLSVVEISRSLDVSLSTVEREWRFARRWLEVQLETTGRSS